MKVKRRQFSIYLQRIKHHLSGTVGSFIPVKDEADRAARLNRNYVWVIATLYQYLNFLNTVVGTAGLCFRSPSAKKVPEFPGYERQTQNYYDGVNQYHVLSYS